MNNRFSKSANAYVKVTRAKHPDDPNWLDIARAYDAGMLHGVEARATARRQLEELRDGLTEGASRP